MDEKKQEPIVYVSGKYVPETEARISVFDHVILYGDGVYDTMCAWNHMVFKLDEHVDRLYESAHAVKLTVPLSKEKVKEAILETVKRNDLQNAYVKIIVTRGVGPQPLMSPKDCKPAVIVFAVPYMSLVVTKGEDKGYLMLLEKERITLVTSTAESGHLEPKIDSLETIETVKSPPGSVPLGRYFERRAS